MFLDLHFGFAMSGANRLKSIGSVKLGLLKSNAAIFVDKKTHMRVVVCEIPGPLCQADIIIPTECFDNKGLPHCLEHLIFMGSESFPFRGYLDKLANLCVAQGTNAWTDRDHTAYCAVTAGKEGLLRLLPVFLDHVIRPKLTDLQFQTEIYHVDGDGKQGGVVFCEMQVRLNLYFGGTIYNEKFCRDANPRKTILLTTPYTTSSFRTGNSQQIRSDRDERICSSVTPTLTPS